MSRLDPETAAFVQERVIGQKLTIDHLFPRASAPLGETGVCFGVGLSLAMAWLAAGMATSAACAQLRVAAGRAEGWPVLHWQGEPLSQTAAGPAAGITVEGRPALDGALASEGTSDAAIYDTFAGRLTDTIEPFPAFPNCFRRRLVFENATDKQRDLTGADFRVAPVASANAKRWQAQSFAMVECQPGGPTLCAAFTSDEDRWTCQFSLGRRPVVTHHANAAWRLPPGGRATIGTQYLWVIDGDLEVARASAQDWYDAVGLTVADGGPPWLGDCVVYQASAGGSVDSRWGDCGGFDNFAKQLGFISDLGCNAFWLMSVMTHKEPADPKRGWNLYGPTQFHEVDPAYGGEAALTRLVTAMRQRGFRVFNEIVPSGGHAELCAQHPEWWTYRENGERREGFGHALDYSAPGWQAIIKESIRWLTAGWGFEGYRVDVADGYGLNWKSPTNGAHVSLSTQGGSIGMLRAIREGALEGGATEPVVIPETLDNRPEYARFGNLGYGFRLIFNLEQWFHEGLSPAQLRQALTDYFENERGSLPRGMLSLRAINNHDTIVSHGRADRRFGVGLQRALTGVCCLVEGVPMIYHEQEVGSYHHFRRLFWARRRVPAMCRGSADYLGVKAPAEVFGVLRSLEAQRAVGLVNLSPAVVEAAIELPAGVVPAGGTTLFEALSGRSLRVAGPQFRWSLAPHATAILRVGRPPERSAPGERHRQQSVSDVAASRDLDARRVGKEWRVAGGGLGGALRAESTSLTVAPNPDGTFTVHAQAPAAGPAEVTLRLTGVDRWLASTETGVYEDRLLRRHYPWPEGLLHWDPTIVWGYEPHNLYRARLPSGRQWQSAVAPLHPGDSRIAFAGGDGSGFELRGIRTNAMNVVLTDHSAQPDPEPYGLTLRFLARDEALHPRWTPGHRRAGWTEIPGPAFAHQDEPLSVSFTIGPLSQFGEALAAAAPRVPLPSAGTREVGRGKHHGGWDRLWLVEPNTVTWSNLALTADGEFTLWMQLRHSEQGPDKTDLCGHYQVELDGRPLALAWPRLNVWRTGNGYFGWARAAAGKLTAGRHELKLTTTHTWCALHPKLYISRDPEFAP